MSYSVICPTCNERNPGNAFNCVKCQTSLVGVPRQEDLTSKPATPLLHETPAKSTTTSSNVPKIESLGYALWRSLRGSLLIFFAASLLTAAICLLGRLTLADFGTGLIYIGVVLVFIGWFIFNGSQQFVRGQTDFMDPTNRALPGPHSARTKQYWRDYMDGMNSVAVIGFSVALCFVVGWLVISLAS